MEKTLKELYTILLDNLDDYFHRGLCWTIAYIPYYSQYERKRLLNDLEKRRPNPFSKFFWDESFNKKSYFKPAEEAYWWEKGNIEIRRKFLQHIINKL